MAVTIRGRPPNHFEGSEAMIDFNKIAEQIRQSFATGKPCTIPLMTVRDLGRVLDLLDDGVLAAA
jgi:hypothetical protein